MAKRPTQNCLPCFRDRLVVEMRTRVWEGCRA